MLNRCLNEPNARFKVLREVFPGDVHRTDHFVLEVGGETGVQPRDNLQYVRDTLYTKESKREFYYMLLHGE